MHGGAGFLNVVQKNFGAAHRELLHTLANRCQTGDAVLPQGDAVVPGYRDILRHPQTMVLQGADGTQRHQVGHGEHGGDVGRRFQQAFHRLVAVSKRKACVGILFFKGKRQPQPQHGALYAG